MSACRAGCRNAAAGVLVRIVPRGSIILLELAGSETVYEGFTRLVFVDGQLVMLVWPDGGELKAFQGVCPHTAQPLPEDQFDGGACVIKCPVHGWTWEPATGAPIHPRESALAEYPVKVEGDHV